MIEAKIQRAFFYLDYLRMHSFARKKKIFRKNRYMISHLTSTDAKKGYTAYIQRLFRDLIIDRFKRYNLDIKKPRDIFGYNVDNPNVYSSYTTADQRYLPIFDGEPMDKVRYAYRRLLLYKDFVPQFTEVVNQINETTTLQHNTGLSFKIRLDIHKSDGWKTYQAIDKIASAYEAIEEEINPKDYIKKSIIALLAKTRKPTIGMQFHKLGYDGRADTNIVYTITDVSERLNDAGFVDSYAVYYEDGAGRRRNINNAEMSLLFNAEGSVETIEVIMTRELCQRAITILSESVGIQDDAALRLAKSALVREYQGDTEKLHAIMGVDVTENLVDYMRGML
jgi:hypothetical protein